MAEYLTIKADNSKTAYPTLDDKGKQIIKIRFNNNNYDLMNKMNTIPGRKYFVGTGHWTTPMNPKAIEMLMEWEFEVDNELKTFLQQTNEKRNHVIATGVPDFKGKLYPFQTEVVAFTEINKGRILNALEMGLGKTISSLAWLKLHPELRPVIIVVPASLKINWQRETEKWMPKSQTEVLSGTTPQNVSGDVIIINYDILHAWIEELKKVNPEILILDEIHYISSNKIRRTKATKLLAKGIPHIIALSGTPVMNRPIDIFNAVKIINPEIFPDRRAYIKRYCKGTGCLNELNYILKNTVMIRMLKADVLKDLPEKIRSFVPMELDNLSEYKLAENDFISFICQNKDDTAVKKPIIAEALVKYEILKQMAVKGKLKQCVSWIRDFIEIDGKLVVFATHRFVIDSLMEAFPDVAVKIDGSVNMKDRQAAVDKFQNDPDIKLFIGNVQAAGVGITLTASSNITFIELPWTSAAINQAEDRCHRIGQKNVVNIYHLLAENTVEEKIAKLIDKKRKVLDAILDGKETEQESLLMELIRVYRDENS